MLDLVRFFRSLELKRIELPELKPIKFPDVPWNAEPPDKGKARVEHHLDTGLKNVAAHQSIDIATLDQTTENRNAYFAGCPKKDRPLASTAHVDALIRDVWKDVVSGKIGDAEAERRVALLEAQRPVASPIKGWSPLGSRPAVAGARRFKPRRYQYSPDRVASRNRRRTLARGGDMPPPIRARYTEGEAATLSVIAQEVRHHGACDLSVDAIAARAGVCRTVVQNTLRQAKMIDIHVEHRPQKGRKHLTNVITVISREWLTWIKRRTRIGLRLMNPTTMSEGQSTRTRPSPVDKQHGIRQEAG